MMRFLLAALLGYVFEIVVSQISVLSLNSIFAGSNHPRSSSWFDVAIPLAAPGLLIASDPPNGVENDVGDRVDNDSLPWIFAGNGFVWSVLATLGFLTFTKMRLFFRNTRHAR